MTESIRRNVSILMIAPQPFFRARGTPFSVLHRIRALLELGHSVDLVTYPFGDPVPLDDLVIYRSARPPFVSDISIGPSIRKILLDIPLYFTARKRLREKQYDVIHSHEEAAFFAVGLARKHGALHVYDMHSSLPQQLENFRKYNLGPVRRMFETLERYVLTSCDGVITICQDLADTVGAFGISAPHTMIENTGDDTQVFRPHCVDVRKKYDLLDKKIVLYTGTFEAYQGLPLLMEAFAAVRSRRKEVHLLMVGGRERQIEEMKDFARSLDVMDGVTFSGTVPSNQIPSFLAAADIIASPRSSGTNTPLKLYGYMKSGIPLVATDKYTHTQTLDRGTAHLVPATSEGMAQGLLRLLDDPEYAQSLANAARQVANEKYSDRAYLKRVADFYDQVVDNSATLAES